MKKVKVKTTNLGDKQTKSEEKKSTLPSLPTSSWYVNMINMTKVKIKTNKWKWRKKLQEIADQVWRKDEEKPHMMYHSSISSNVISSYQVKTYWKVLQDEKNQLLITCLWLNLVIASNYFSNPPSFLCICLNLQNVFVSNCQMYMSQIAKCICLLLQNVFGTTW